MVKRKELQLKTITVHVVYVLESESEKVKG